MNDQRLGWSLSQRMRARSISKSLDEIQEMIEDGWQLDAYENAVQKALSSAYERLGGKLQSVYMSSGQVVDDALDESETIAAETRKFVVELVGRRKG